MTGRWARRFAWRRCRAAGIDVGAGEIRVAVLSRVGGGAGVRLEGLEAEPFGAPDGRDAAGSAAAGRALAAALGRLSARGVRCGTRGVMALGDDAMRMAVVDLAGRDDVSEAARQAAERVSGLAPDEIAFDWRDDAGVRPGEIAIAAASQTHVQGRIDAAALAGIELTAIDGASIAALRALRYAALRELDARESYFAIWFGHACVRGWWLHNGAAGAQFSFPDCAHATLADALRAVAQRPARCAFVGGDARCLARFGMTLADVGDLLGAIALPFEGAHWAGDAPPAGRDDLHSPAFAVAFGLALKGVWE